MKYKIEAERKQKTTEWIKNSIKGNFLDMELYDKFYDRSNLFEVSPTKYNLPSIFKK